MVPHEGDGLFRYAARLGGVAPRLECSLHPHKVDRKRRRLRGRESDQLTTIELLVGKPDQTLAAAPVVPPERTALTESLLTAFEDDASADYLCAAMMVAGVAAGLSREADRA